MTKSKAQQILNDARAIAWRDPVDAPSALARVLAVAERARRRTAPLEPWEEAPEPLQRVRGLLDHYEADVRQLDEDAIHRRQPDRLKYALAIVALLEEYERRGRFKLACELEAEGGMPPECSCRCRAHNLHGCAACLRTERCTVHTDEDPARVSPRWRRMHASKRFSPAAPGDPEDEPAVVHVLRYGLPPCGFTRQTPSLWPAGHRWVRAEDIALSTCAGCLAACGVDASARGELRELPRGAPQASTAAERTGRRVER